MSDNPYEPPQQENLSPDFAKAEFSPQESVLAEINARIVRKYFLLTTPLLFIFCGVFGAIYNPKSMWWGNEVGRIENFFLHAWPISVGPGVINMFFWPIAFVVVFGASLSGSMMRDAASCLIVAGIAGFVLLVFGAITRGNELTPMMLGDGCAIIFFVVLTGIKVDKLRSSSLHSEK